MYILLAIEWLKVHTSTSFTRRNRYELLKYNLTPPLRHTIIWRCEYTRQLIINVQREYAFYMAMICNKHRT